MNFLKISYLVDCKGNTDKLMEALEHPKNRIATFVLDDTKYHSSVVSAAVSDGDVDVEVCNDSYLLSEKYKILKDHCAKALADKLDVLNLIGQTTKLKLEVSTLEAKLGYLQRHCDELKSKVKKQRKLPDKDLVTACSRLLNTQTKSEREMTIQEIIHIVKKEIKNVG